MLTWEEHPSLNTDVQVSDRGRSAPPLWLGKHAVNVVQINVFDNWAWKGTLLKAPKR